MNYYDENANLYCAATFDEMFSNEIFSRIDIESFKSVKVLEVGSGSGRDVKYLTDKGFDVTAIELSPQMIETAQKLTGLDKFTQGDAKTFRTGETYGLIYSIACLHHLDDIDFCLATCNMFNHLKEGGTLFITVKKNARGKDSMGRFFNYFDEEKLRKLINNSVPSDRTVYKLDVTVTEDLVRSDTKWLNATIQLI